MEEWYNIPIIQERWANAMCELHDRTLQNTTYKVPSNMLCASLLTYTDKITGNYQSDLATENQSLIQYIHYDIS
jgi:hypothetical protein